MITWILIIIGMLELLEGLAIAIWPKKVKECLSLWTALPNRKFRLISIVALAVGLILIHLGLYLR